MPVPLLEYLQPPEPRPTSMNYRLPVELICLIFTMLTQEYYTVKSKDRALIFLDVIHLSQVCRLWRQAALGFEQIWASIFDIDAKTVRVQEILFRAGISYPLTIKSRPGRFRNHTQPRFTSPKWAALFTHMEQVQELDITISERNPDFYFLGRMLHLRSAPILRAARLSYVGQPFHSNGVPSWAQLETIRYYAALSSPLFQGMARNLRCLVLNYYIIDPSRLMSLDLTHLEITARKLPSPLAPWLVFLNSQQNLEHLKFDFFFSPPDPSYMRRRRELLAPIPRLRKLKVLILQVNGEEDATLLGSLVLPTSSDLSLIWTMGRTKLFDNSRPILETNPLFLGLERRFRDWADEARLNPKPYFFWEITIGYGSVSIRVSTCDEYGGQQGSCVEVAFRMEHSEGDTIQFGHDMRSACFVILDLIKRSSSAIHGFKSIVSVVATHRHRDGSVHFALMKQLTALLERLSKSTTTLMLSGAQIDSFIIYSLYGVSDTTPLFPNLQRMDFETFLAEKDNVILLIEYLQWRVQPHVVGKRIPVLNLIPLDIGHVDDDPASSGFPQNDEYQADFIEMPVGKPCLHLKPWCTSCRYSGQDDTRI